MKKKDDEKGQRKLTLEEALEATRSIFGTKKPQDRLDKEHQAVKVEGEAKQEKLPPGALLSIGVKKHDPESGQESNVFDVVPADLEAARVNFLRLVPTRTA